LLVHEALLTCIDKGNSGNLPIFCLIAISNKLTWLTKIALFFRIYAICAVSFSGAINAQINICVSIK